MAKPKNDEAILSAFSAGWDAMVALCGDVHTPNPHLFSSSMWEAWYAGQEAWRAGRPKPAGAWMGRGHTVRTTDGDYRITYRYASASVALVS